VESYLHDHELSGCATDIIYACHLYSIGPFGNTVIIVIVFSQLKTGGSTSKKGNTAPGPWYGLCRPMMHVTDHCKDLDNALIQGAAPKKRVPLADRWTNNGPFETAQHLGGTQRSRPWDLGAVLK
jgi:hypothetical protein